MSNFSGIQKSKFFDQAGGIDEYNKHGAPANRFRRAINIHIDDKKLKFRPGKRLWGPTFSQSFKGAFEFIDTSGTTHLLVASDSKLYTVTASTKTSLGAVSNEDIHIHDHRGKCWINGASTQKKFDGTNYHDVGLAAPSTAATAAAGASTGLTGNYSYKITFVIESSGVRVYESDPSAASNDVTLADQDAALTSIPVSGDARINARYIYRTEAGGAKWYYVGKISNNTATTYTDSLADSSLGDEVEYTHGQPATAEISRGINERLGWIDGSLFRYSEAAYTEAYMEYQQSTSFYRQPKNGRGKGLAPLYNPDTGREDAYIFAEKAVSILTNGDPTYPLYTLSNTEGCGQHDTICEYDNGLAYLSTNNAVKYIKNRRIIDISSLNIPETMDSLVSKSSARAGVIFDHYYALCCRTSSTKLYNHVVLICDLRTIQEVSEGKAVAVWYQWNIDAEYILQRKDGTVLVFDNNAKRIFSLSLQYATDQDSSGETTNIVAQWDTVYLPGNEKIDIMKALQVCVSSNNCNGLSMIAKYADELEKTTVASTAEARENPVAFVMGASVMGSRLSSVPVKVWATVSSDKSGSGVSFQFSKNGGSGLFYIDGIQFTYTGFSRGR